MTYQVFARKYRPQTFDEVLGQEAIVQTLKNALAQNRLHHAYLFCGARGVGKTSLARIFAKSLNCEAGPTPTPCQKCAACEGITKGNAIDVLEIDGASNTGVDDVRELREQAKYLPATGKYKIYIIDEVHMLSTNAFNALLKILEEPPSHLIFIFATTEPHEIPVTILSRCQRFDFRRMSEPQLVGHLKKILASEGLTINAESLLLIAHAAEGSVRDGLSLLDQIVSFCGKEVSADNVRDILGLADRVVLFEMLEALLASDIPSLLQKGNDLFDRGFDLKIFSESLLELLRNLLVTLEGAEKYVDAAPGEKERLQKLISQTDAARVLMLFQILARGTEELARSQFPKMVFETTLIKMARARDYLLIPEILDKLNSPSIPTQPKTPMPSLKSQVPPVAPTPSKAEKGNSPLQSALQSGMNTWRNFVDHVMVSRPQVGAILEHAHALKMETETIVLGFDPKSIYKDMLKERLDAVVDIAHTFFKKKITFKIETMADGQPKGPTVKDMKQQEDAKHRQEVEQKALSNPAVRKAQEILGAKVKEIKEIT